MVSIPVLNSYVFSVLNRTGNRKQTWRVQLGWTDRQAYLDVESLFGVCHGANFIDRVSIDDTRWWANLVVAIWYDEGTKAGTTVRASWAMHEETCSVPFSVRSTSSSRLVLVFVMFHAAGYLSASRMSEICLRRQPIFPNFMYPNLKERFYWTSSKFSARSSRWWESTNEKERHGNQKKELEIITQTRWHQLQVAIFIRTASLPSCPGYYGNSHQILSPLREW